ncbi:unnamed protein product, partial [marine sediment metagenome]
MSDDKFLTKKVVLITGAGSGFGRAFAIAFANKGANLVLNDINMKGLEETRDLVLKDNNVEILLAQADISECVIKIANEQGIENCFMADIFKYHPSKKYDTITLFENNIGLAGT